MTFERLSWICLVLLLVASTRWAAADVSKIDHSQQERWQQLRQVQGHFDGGKWNDQVDRWQGEKHRLMQQMAQTLHTHGASKGDIQETFGAPDNIQEPASESASSAYQHTLKATEWQGEPAGELWLYHWRGEHDQLVLAVEGDQLVAIGWLMVLE